MPIEVRVPQVADAPTTVKLAAWLKREGDPVAAGEPIAEVETDKTTVEVEAPGPGVLHRIHVAAGTEGLEVGAVLAVILGVEDEEAPDASSSIAALASSTVSDEATARAEATPLASRMAQIAEIDLHNIPGSGPAGRIGKSDIDRVLAGRRSGVATSVSPRFDPPSNAAAVTLLPQTGQPAFEQRPLTSMRRVTAARLQQAKQTIPHFYLSIDCVADAMLSERARANARIGNAKVTITDFIVRATALALKKVPVANSTWAEDSIRIYHAIDIAVAVSTLDGLITPIIRGADGKSVVAISRELRTLAERARLRDLRPDEYTGGTFTISNLGMFGISSLYAIVNPPQSCILGVGAAEQRAIVRGGHVVGGMVMTCTLSADHRAIDGAAGAKLLAEIRRLIEDPGVLSDET